ncbi:MAG: ABC transporter ATP-binding protein [Chitinispirillaceae bacterium]|nr:ABC transporter ATP-binding protein [Chitinispirillaceae bacterium]
MTAEPAILMKDVSFSYGREPAVESVTLTVGHGDFVGVIGPNGGGKTTLLRLMLGLIKPHSGSVTLLGGTPHATRHRVGYVPQETGLNKSFPVAVRDVTLMGLAGKRGLGKRFLRADYLKADIMLERLGLSSVKNRPIGQLSGGQRQKALLARAMVADPEMLFLDEPTASIDAAGSDELYEHLRLLNGTGVTVVLVTHNVGILSRYVKSVACVNKTLFFHPDGKIDQESVNKTFGCEVDLIAHGVPHRVFHAHEGDCRHD